MMNGRETHQDDGAKQQRAAWRHMGHDGDILWPCAQQLDNTCGWTRPITSRYRRRRLVQVAVGDELDLSTTGPSISEISSDGTQLRTTRRTRKQWTMRTASAQVQELRASHKSLLSSAATLYRPKWKVVSESQSTEHRGAA